MSDAKEMRFWKACCFSMKEIPDFKKVQAMVAADFSHAGSVANKYRAAKREFEATLGETVNSPATPAKKKPGRKPKPKAKKGNSSAEDEAPEEDTKRPKKRARIDTDTD